MLINKNQKIGGNILENFSFLNHPLFGQQYLGKLDLDLMFSHILKLEEFICCNRQLFIYNFRSGYYIPIPECNEWHILSVFFSNEIKETIKPRQANEMIERLKNTLSIQCSADNFNQSPDLINTVAGPLNYTTKEICEDSASYRFNYRLNVKYLNNCSLNDAPTFKKFCETSLEGSPEKIKLFLQILGYLSIPSLAAKKCFIFLGAPNSGKSQLLHLIENIFGEENISNISLNKLGDRFSIAQLSRSRLNICGELSGKILRNIDTFKLIVGGDRLSGEFKNKDIFTFKNQCKLIFAGNMLPPIQNEEISSAFADRLTILYFPNQVPVGERDVDLLNKLIKEKNIIFSLGIDTLSDLISSNYEFIVPNDSKEILSDYSYQQFSIDEFLDESCELGPDYRIHTSDLYAAYKSFCQSNAIDAISVNLFSQKIGTIKGVKASRFHIDGSKSLRGFTGVTLKHNLQDSDLYSRGEK